VALKQALGPITTYCCGPNNRGVAIQDKVLSPPSTPSWSLDARGTKVW
jgi:hypothetical protein